MTGPGPGRQYSSRQAWLGLALFFLLYLLAHLYGGLT